MTRPLPPLYVPALQLDRRPLTQTSPGEHITASARTDTGTSSGTEYHPEGTGEGAEAPARQNTVAFVPQGNTVSLAEPSGHKYPARQSPEQLELVRPA